MASPSSVDISVTEPTSAVTDTESLPRRQPSQAVKPQSRTSVSYNRRRAGNACLVCRARKTKCDNQRPVCGFCAATGGNCRYVESDPSHFDRASLSILQRIGQLEKSLKDHIDQSLGLRSDPMIEDRQATSNPLLDVEYALDADTQLGGVEAGLFVTSDNQRNKGQDLHASNSDTLSEDMPVSAEVLLHAYRMSVDSVLKWPIYSQIAPHLIKDFQMPIVEVLTSEPRITHAASNIGTALHNLTPNVIGHLVENFLKHNHVKNPILDVETLRTDAREFSESGPQWDGRSCLMFLVCAISSLSSPLAQDVELGASKSRDELAIAEAYFQASQRRIGMLYHENTLLAAQCSFLTGVYLMMTMQILAAWKCFVQSATQCLAWLAGCGRRNTRDSLIETGEMMSDKEVTKGRHVEESLYWSCLKSEMELCFELGLPGSGLNEMRYPSVYPSPPVDLPIEPSYNTPDTYWSSPRSYISVADRQNLETGWFFYLAEIATKRIVSNALNWSYKTRFNQMDTDHELGRGIVEFETQIQEWYEALPPPMKFPRHPKIPTDDILRYILRGHMLDIREMVRFSAIEAILASTSPVTSPAISPTIIRLTQEFLVNAVDRIEANREGLFHRHHGTWLGLRSCGRSALQLLGMACKCLTDATATGLNGQDLGRRFLPPHWKDAVLLVSESVEYWADSSPDISRMNKILKELMRIYEVMVGVR